MLTKNITYTDLNGKERTDQYMFHMSKADVIRLEAELSTPEEFEDGSTTALERVINKFVETKNIHEIVMFFEDLIKRSFGVKSEDGRSFLKYLDASDAFMQSPAYDVLLIELLSNEQNAIAFFSAILPDDISPSIEHMSNVSRG